jgi:hypothetical protein
MNIEINILTFVVGAIVGYLIINHFKGPGGPTGPHPIPGV